MFKDIERILSTPTSTTKQVLTFVKAVLSSTIL